MDQKTKVLNALKSNRNGVSAAKFESNYNIGNVFEVVRRLREDGHAVYANKSKNGSTTFRLGTPSRAMVALAARVFGAQAFR